MAETGAEIGAETTGQANRAKQQGTKQKIKNLRKFKLLF